MTKRKPATKKRVPKFGTKAWEDFAFQDLPGFPDPDSYYWHVNDYTAALLNWCQCMKLASQSTRPTVDLRRPLPANWPRPHKFCHLPLSPMRNSCGAEDAKPGGRGVHLSSANIAPSWPANPSIRSRLVEVCPQ